MYLVCRNYFLEIFVNKKPHTHKRKNKYIILMYGNIMELTSYDSDFSQALKFLEPILEAPNYVMYH